MVTRKAAPFGPAVGASERPLNVPAWVPEAARDYLAHTEGGQTIRALARQARVAPSTILRRVRRVESSRDDPLVDAALRQLSAGGETAAATLMSEIAIVGLGGGRASLAHQAMPILRRLSEPGTVLAIARDMEKGLVVREDQGGDPQRLAVVERTLAEAMALQDWIACGVSEARVNRYRITPEGRAVVRALLAESPQPNLGGASQPLAAGDDDEDTRLRHMRSILLESPLSALARRRDAQGTPFLGRDLVAAGERLREDFELAHRALPGVTDWDVVLAALPDAEAGRAGSRPGPQAARLRVVRALQDLGPGLADVALRCCCFLEGLEAFEVRMGWSARSGKVVLRIALERLARHYREASEASPLIG